MANSLATRVLRKLNRKKKKGLFNKIVQNCASICKRSWTLT